MYDPKASKQPKLETFVGLNRVPSQATVISDAVPSEDQIQERAYQLYERGGRQHGQDREDWIAAEQILNRRW